MGSQEPKGLRLLQVNLDRGRAATLLAEKLFSEHYDVACIQEPYVKFSQTERFYRHKVDGSCKAEIWTKTDKATTVTELTTANYVTIRLRGSTQHT